MSFRHLGLAPEIQRVLTESGYTEPTPIQSQAIPAVLAGKDMIACAQTGTGKTAAFTLPLIQRLSEDASRRGSRKAAVLVLTPTRELALQIGESVRTYGQYLSLRSTVIYGGVNINTQIQHLRAGVDILIATPGRLLDHLQQRTVDLSGINVLVLDEADRMLDMGFIRDVRKIVATLPKQRQNLLFSATFSREIKALAGEFLNSPTVIEVARSNAAADSVQQLVHPVDRSKKRALLTLLIRNNNWQQVLVFTRTKHGANRLAKQLEQDGLSATAIHGNKSQGARVLALKQFKAGSVRVLVATDIAARGIDINQLPYVVNYDLPNVPEDYVHRIGRTGRAGCQGQAVSLVSSDEHKLLAGIERLLKKKIPSIAIEDYASAGGGNHDDYDDRPPMQRPPSRPRNQQRPQQASGRPRSPSQQGPRGGQSSAGNSRPGGQRSSGGSSSSGNRSSGGSGSSGNRSSSGSGSSAGTREPVTSNGSNGPEVQPPRKRWVFF